MVLSVDGKVHKGNLSLKCGDEFPRLRRNMKISHPEIGISNVYVIWIGQPEWKNPLEVVVPIKYYITEVVEPTVKHLRNERIERLGLKIIGGVDHERGKG